MNAFGKLSVVSCLALWPAVSAAQSYSIMDLAVGSPFDDAFAYGISQNGKITGTGTVTATGELHAFIWDRGVFQDLGMLGYGGADGVSINNSGQVAATGYGPGWHALLYSNGHVTSIGGGETALNSEGLAINNLGHVVGRIQGDDGGFQPFSWFGSFSTLPMNRALGINDSDQIAGSVGYTWVYGGYLHQVAHACVLTGNTLVELGNLGGGLRTYTEAYGINSAGQVTGYSTLADGSIHAFLYSGGAMSDLGTIAPYYSYGLSINIRGEVIGQLQTYVGGPVGSFLYSNGRLRDLAEVLGPAGAAWTGLTAAQINDSGWIVGYGTINGATHGFLARPKVFVAVRPHG